MNRPATSSTFDAAQGLAPQGPARDSFASGGRDNTKLFKRAHRHSRRVRFLRYAIPIVIVVVFGGFMLSSYFNPLRLLRLPAEIGGLTVSGTKITMSAPKLTGYTRDDRWYELTATSAAQDITKPDLVELNDIHAKIQMQDKSTVELKAVKGLLDRKAGVLTLDNDIHLSSSSGIAVHLDEAVVDTTTGDIVSNKPVQVEMAQGTLSANRLEVTKSGEVVRFDGGVVMNLNAQAVDESTK